MKLYLILLVISGIAFLITNFEIRTVIKKYGYKRLEKPIREEKILGGIKAIIMWLMIIPYILGVLASILNSEAYEKGILNGLEKGNWG
jgi:hypothetical protein